MKFIDTFVSVALKLFDFMLKHYTLYVTLEVIAKKRRPPKIDCVKSHYLRENQPHMQALCTENCFFIEVCFVFKWQSTWFT